jgi:hypothetical protein
VINGETVTLNTISMIPVTRKDEKREGGSDFDLSEIKKPPDKAALFEIRNVSANKEPTLDVVWIKKPHEKESSWELRLITAESTQNMRRILTSRIWK